MKRYGYIISIAIVSALAAGCSSDMPLGEEVSVADAYGELDCVIETDDLSGASRTHYEYSKSSKTYYGYWDTADELAVSFDKAPVTKFTLVDGDGRSKGTFRGVVPVSYTTIRAISPYAICRGVSEAGFDVVLPETLPYTDLGILRGGMPMLGRGGNDAMTFHNLCGVLKLQLKGNALLHGITVSSTDGYPLSGKGVVTDNSGVPSLTLTERGRTFTLNLGAVLLDSEEYTDFYLPIPARRYDSGLKITIAMEGGEVTKHISSSIDIEPSVVRPVSPIELGAGFNLDSYTPSLYEIWYTATRKASYVAGDKAIDAVILSNSFNAKMGVGVIYTDNPVTEITGHLFENGTNISSVRLPDGVRKLTEKAMYNMQGLTEFVAPKSLRTLGTEAFGNCLALKKLVLNDGCESIGLACFEMCKNLEYVHIPASVTMVSAYSFLQATENLDHWDGDSPMIDDDRHALYGNNAYGIVSNESTQIDVVAGCNLTEYTIPARAESLENYAMYGLKNLKRLTIGTNVKNLGHEPFSPANSLETIVCHAVTPPTLSNDSRIGIANVKDVYVPDGSVDAYCKAKGWSAMASSIKPLSKM